MRTRAPRRKGIVLCLNSAPRTHNRSGCTKYFGIRQRCLLRPSYPHPHDPVRLAADRAIVVLTALLDGVHVLHAGRDLAPYGVRSIKPRPDGTEDDESAVGGVRMVGARHRDRPAHLRFVR